MSSPTVVGGVVYVGTHIGYFVYAIDARTGGEKWRFATEGWVDSSPYVAGGIVYVGSNDGYVYALY
jgi:outer membrane protein assembly factor BamB